MTPNIEIEEKNPEASEMTSKFAYIGKERRRCGRQKDHS